jgi:hypothetical protein
MVGEEGIEPSIREEHDFESCAYTSSATRPKVLYRQYIIPVMCRRLQGVIVLYLGLQG